MVRARHTVAVLLAAALAACGGVEPPLAPLLQDPPNDDPNLAGTFFASFHGSDQGVGLQATLSFTFAESSGVLVGTFNIQGRLDDGENPTDVAGSGLVVGTVTADDRAAVSFTAQPEFCLGHTGDFAGFYDRLTGVLGILGQVVVLNEFCEIVLTYPIDLAMRR
jgi:hypothetical protein